MNTSTYRHRATHAAAVDTERTSAWRCVAWLNPNRRFFKFVALLTLEIFNCALLGPVHAANEKSVAQAEVPIPAIPMAGKPPLAFGQIVPEARKPANSATELKVYRNAMLPPTSAPEKQAIGGEDYLGESTEVRFTPAIRQLAEQLGNQPVAIYNWVRNQIDYVPTWGSIQGADYTLQTGQGNAFDISSLLVALYRVAGIQARYRFGTIDLPVDLAMNWLGGVERPEQVLAVLGQGGIPASGLASGGRIVAIRLEHVWVEAWIDYFPSRGAVQREGDTWLPLDASLKRYEYSAAPDLQNPAVESVREEIRTALSGLSINPADGAIEGLEQVDFASLLPRWEDSLADAVFDEEQSWRGRAIARMDFPVLPSGLMGSGHQDLAVASELPDSARIAFSFALYRNEAERTHEIPQLYHRIALPELVGRQLQLRYRPASDADRRLIEEQLPDPSDSTATFRDLPRRLPGHRIRLIAELRLDSQVVASAGPYTLGQALVSVTTIDRLGGGQAVAVNQPDAGEWLYLAVNPGSIPAQELTDSVYNDPENVFPSMARSWFANVDAALETLSLMGLGVTYRHPSFGTFSTELDAEIVLGAPRNVNLGGVAVDIDYLGETVVPLAGGDLDEPRLREILGSIGSALEYEVPVAYIGNADYPATSVSAVSALALAQRQGQRLHSLTENNLESVLPTLSLSPETREDLRFHVANGHQALVSAGQIQSGDWRGEGYLLIDPQTGAGAYRIRGGSNGGAAQSELDKSLALVGMGNFVGFVRPLEVPPSFGQQPSCSIDSGDGERVGVRIPWWAIIAAIVLLAIIVASGGAAGGALAPALAVLARFFLPILRELGRWSLPLGAASTATAMADEGDCKVYVSASQSTRLTPMTEITSHVQDAQAGGSPSTLEFLGYTSSIGTITANVDNGDDSGGDRTWYRKEIVCSRNNRDQFKDKNDVEPDCDEYPFYSTRQGAGVGITDGVSLRLVPRRQNQAQGGTLRQFYAKCRISANDPYEVRTDLSEGSVTHGALPGGEVCYGRR